MPKLSIFRFLFFIFPITLSSLLIFVRCSETIIPEPVNADSVFFPLQVGLFREYEVDRIDYRNTGEIDTSIFFLREQVVDSFLNVENKFTYIINLSTRATSDDPWRLDSVWTARHSAFQAIQTEDNLAFVKLVFPIREGTEWDGNVFNNLENEEYFYDSVGVSRSIDSLNFNNTVTVVQSDFADGFTREDIRQEIFAENIGLIYRQRLILEFCTLPECLETPEQEIDIGVDYVQRIIGYGIE